MTEMKETAFIMQNVSERYDAHNLFTTIASNWSIFFFGNEKNSCCMFLLSLWKQESHCHGWTWEGYIFLWWTGNSMELLWVPVIIESVSHSPKLITYHFCFNQLSSRLTQQNKVRNMKMDSVSHLKYVAYFRTYVMHMGRSYVKCVHLDRTQS